LFRQRAFALLSPIKARALEFFLLRRCSRRKRLKVPWLGRKKNNKFEIAAARHRTFVALHVCLSWEFFIAASSKVIISARVPPRRMLNACEPVFRVLESLFNRSMLVNQKFVASFSFL